MRTLAIIEGLKILQKYRTRADGCNCSADWNMLYADATNRPVEGADLSRMVELGWFQEWAKYDMPFAVTDYDPKQLWTCAT